MALRGFCYRAHASYDGSCAEADSGLWPTPPGEGVEGCVKRCLGCARCRYISVARGACAWYSRCNVDDLRTWWGVSHIGANWTTLEVRNWNRQLDAPPAEAPATPEGRQLRLAIAALTFGPSEHCALVAWCQGARRLQRVLSVPPWQSSIVVVWDNATGMLPPASGGCPDAAYLPIDPKLRRLAKTCLRSKGHGVARAFMLLKWQFFSMTQFNAVLHIDLDMDIFPVHLLPRAVRQRWRSFLPVFLRRRSQLRVDNNSAPSARLSLLALADHESPVNGGMLLFRPQSRLYADGLKVLRRCRFNHTHGWELVGRPNELGVRPRFLSPVRGGLTAIRSPDAPGGEFWMTDPNSTAAQRRNDWMFNAALGDQGFFWYMLFLRHRDGGAYFPHERPEHFAFHYWGTIGGAKAWGGRPWTSEAHARGECSARLWMNLHYLSRLEPTTEALLSPSPCAVELARMRELRRSAEAHPAASRRNPPFKSCRRSYFVVRFGLW